MPSIGKIEKQFEFQCLCHQIKEVVTLILFLLLKATGIKRTDHNNSIGNSARIHRIWDIEPQKSRYLLPKVALHKNKVKSVNIHRGF